MEYIDNGAPLLDGWISREECDLVSRWMKTETGNILETGSAVGRLFDYLYPKHRNWNYVSVDPLEHREVFIQLDYTKRYWADGNRGPRVTVDMLKGNIPFAKHYNCDCEEFETEQNVDIISMGMNNPDIKWPNVYRKAFKLLKPGGIIIGRNLFDTTGAINRPDGHKGVKIPIVCAIRKQIVLEIVQGSFVIDGTQWKNVDLDSREWLDYASVWKLKDYENQ